MTNKNRKRIIPRTKDFTLTGDYLEPYFKRVFRFLRNDDTMPVYGKVELTPDLFMEIWELERHLIRLQRIEDTAFGGQKINADQINGETDYPESLLLKAFSLVKEKHEDEQVVLNESLLREIHQGVQEAFSELYPHIPTEFLPRDAEEFYNRGNVRIHQARYAEAIADFVHAAQMDPLNPLYEFALAQFWFRKGKDNQSALLWIDSAISHLDADALCERVYYFQLKVDICIALREYGTAIESLHMSMQTLRFVIEDLQWENGEASLGEGRWVFADGVRCSLGNAAESAEQLLNLVDALVGHHLQSVLQVLVRLRKNL